MDNQIYRMLRRDSMYRRRKNAPVRERQKKSAREYSGPCVKQEVSRIIQAQNEVENDCNSNCKSSIKQLLTQKENPDSHHTTIPFILYCSHTCQPFIGSGVFQSPPEDNCQSFFGCVESPIFRAKKFVGGKENCVILELLLPVTEDCDIPAPSMDSHSSVCPFFPKNNPVTDFLATGICLTVDLDGFNAITCLNPITPIPACEFPPIE